MHVPILCLLLASALPLSALAQPAPATLAPLSWLAGCWQSELDEPGSGEQWMAPAGGVRWVTRSADHQPHVLRVQCCAVCDRHRQPAQGIWLDADAATSRPAAACLRFHSTKCYK